MDSMDYRPEQFRYVLSVDIGIHHLGMVLVELNQDYSFHDLIWFDCVDITQFHHLDHQSSCSCAIPHTRTISDWLAHIFYLHGELLDRCETILIERQPPGGQIAVEQLFFFHFRNKTILIHPRAVHAHFGWSCYSYEQRKEKSCQMLEFRLDRTPRLWLRDAYEALPRQHDVADAYAQVLYFVHAQRKRGYGSPNTCGDLGELEMFRFKLESEYE